jgi:hypothetical protein
MRAEHGITGSLGLGIPFLGERSAFETLHRHGAYNQKSLWGFCS